MLLQISAALLAAAQGVPSNSQGEIPRVVVEGSGSVKKPPTVATLTYDVQGEGSTSDAAVSALVRKGAAIESALRTIDAVMVLHNDKLKIEAVRGTECDDDEYGETAHLSQGACAVIGYLATQDFEIRTSHVTDAGTMVGLAGRHGASGPKIASFGLADQQDARREAIAAALTDARIKAEAIAAGSNARIGKMLSVSLDGARDGDVIVVTGNVGRRTVMEAPTPIVVRVAPGPVETNARVTVTYALAQ